MRDPIDLRSWQAERREAAAVPIVVDEDLTIVVDPIDLWPDDRADDRAVLVHLLGGEANAERYITAGGNYATIARIVIGTDDMGESSGS